MSVYIVTLLLIAVFGSLEYRQRLATSFYMEDIQYGRNNNIFFWLCVAVFLFVGGFRYQVGTDFGAYYKGHMSTLLELLFRFRTLDEPLIYSITTICRWIWNEGIFVIFVMNAITVLLVMKGIKDWEQESWTVQMLMYIMYCGWTGSFNGVRQALAGAMIFAFSKRSKNWWILKYFIVCFNAFLMHKTAIFMFPVLILANRKIDFKQVLIMLGVAFAMPYIGSYALNFIGGTLDTDYASHAVNSIRIMVSFVPIMCILLASEEFWKENNFLVNMAVINALITFSTRNSALMFRFSDYTNMYLMMFIPKLSLIFTEHSQKIFRVVAVLLFFVYFAIEVRTGNGNLNNFQWAFGHFGEF